MFKSFKKSRDIDVIAYAGHQQLIDLFPIEKADKVYPEWFKKMPSPKEKYGEDKNVRMCSGLTDFYKSSYMLTCWQDYEICVTPDGRLFFDSTNKEEYPITGHQLETQAPNAWPGYMNVWSQKNPKDFHVVPGMLEFRFQHGCHVNLIVPIPEKEHQFTIKAGTPLVTLTPMTEKNINLQCQYMDEKKREGLLMEWIFTYRNNYFKRRSIIQKREKNGN